MSNIYEWLAGKAVWLAIVAALLAAVGWQQIRVAHAQKETADVRAQLANDRATYAQAAQKAEKAARTEESRREADKQEAIDHAHTETAAAQAATRDAVAARDGVRKQLATYIAAVRGATSRAAAAGRSTGQQGADPLDLLAQLYGGTDQAAGEIADYARNVFIAGDTCERIADRLQPASGR